MNGVTAGAFMGGADSKSYRHESAWRPVRAGELVELGAVLGNGVHTYTLSAQTSGLVLLLPIEVMNQAFEAYPPMRMRLLEELAREVSRGYDAGCQSRKPKTRRQAFEAPSALTATPEECDSGLRDCPY